MENQSQKPQVNSESGQQAFADFTAQISEMYNTKKIMIVGIVQPQDQTEAQPYLIFNALGNEPVDMKEFSYQMFKMIGNLVNLHKLETLKGAKAENESQD